MSAPLAGMLRGVGKGYRRLEPDVDGALLQEPGVPERPFPNREIFVGVSMFVVGLVIVALGVLIKLEHLQNDVPGAPRFGPRRSMQTVHSFVCGTPACGGVDVRCPREGHRGMALQQLRSPRPFSGSSSARFFASRSLANAPVIKLLRASLSGRLTCLLCMQGPRLRTWDSACCCSYQGRMRPASQAARGWESQASVTARCRAYLAPLDAHIRTQRGACRGLRQPPSRPLQRWDTEDHLKCEVRLCSCALRLLGNICRLDGQRL